MPMLAHFGASFTLIYEAIFASLVIMLRSILFLCPTAPVSFWAEFHSC
jgi:hypothetical protein